MRQKRLMTIAHLFLIHRYRAVSLHYVSPTEDNLYQTQKMLAQGLFTDVHSEIGHIIVAEVNASRVEALLAPDQKELRTLIEKRS